jgi:hypothetical protein
MAETSSRFDPWLRLLDTHRVQYLILDKGRDSRWLDQVRLRTGWTVDFEDSERVLFTRANGSSGA